jgi:hypothetical protein
MQPYRMQCDRPPMSLELGPPDYWPLQAVSWGTGLSMRPNCRTGPKGGTVAAFTCKSLRLPLSQIQTASDWAHKCVGT